jgi:hypothetical protein
MRRADVKCDVDHITPYRDTGITRQDDGQLQCTGHNRDSKLHDLGPHTDTINADDPLTVLARHRLNDVIRRT